MKRRLMILLFSSLSLVVFSQQSVTDLAGSIVDAQSGYPLVGATVQVLSVDILTGGITDIDGKFKINSLPTGRHSIKVSYVGYKESVLQNILLVSGKVTFIEVRLEESYNSLNEIVISAREKQAGELINEMASVSALSVSVEETSRYAASFDDPARAALSFPGVSGNDDISNELIIRGNSPKGLQWRMEGVEIPNPNHFAETGSSGGGISMLSNMVVDQTGFYSGAFPAEFGNALSGVMDVSLRKGNSLNTEFSAEASLIGLQLGGEGPMKITQGSSFLLNYRYSTLALISKMLPLSEILGDNVFQDLAFKFAVPTSNMGTFYLWGLAGKSGSYYESEGTETDWVNSSFEVESGTTGLRHVFFLNPQTSIETHLSFSGNTNNWDADSLALKPFANEKFSENTYRLSSNYKQKLNGGNTVITGFVLSNIKYSFKSSYWNKERQDYDEFLNNRGDAYRVQTFFQWQYRPLDILKINSGVHFQQLSLAGQYSVEPRLGISWLLNPNSTLNFGAGIHSKMESVATYLAIPTGYENSVNRALPLPKAVHLVSGIERKITTSLKLKGEVYYQYLYDIGIVANPENDYEKAFSMLNTKNGYVPFKLSANGTGKNIGFEGMLEHPMQNGLYYMVTASIFQSKYSNDYFSNANSRFNTGYVFNALGGKEFKVKGDNLFSLNARTIIQGGNRFTPINLEQSTIENQTVSDWLNPFSSQVSTYFRFDLGVKYIMNKEKYSSILSLNIQNVTNRLNEFNRYYSEAESGIASNTQMGMLPVLSYKIQF